jgi:hypothetical protein
LPELRADRTFMLHACALDGDCLFYASEDLQVIIIIIINIITIIIIYANCVLGGLVEGTSRPKLLLWD